jgi:hypothetical protein
VSHLDERIRAKIDAGDASTSSEDRLLLGSPFNDRARRAGGRDENVFEAIAPCLYTAPLMMWFP